MSPPRLSPLKFEEVTVEPVPPSRDVQMMYFDSYIMNLDKLAPDLAAARRQVETLVGTGPTTGNAAESTIKILEGLSGRHEVKQLRKWIGLEKVPAVVAMVKAELEANQYDKIALFGCHKAALEELRYGLRMFGAHIVYENTPQMKRHRNDKAFQMDPRRRVIVRQLSAPPAPLTAACQVGVVEADWIAHRNAQAVLQVHQKGQTRPVTVRFFMVQGFDAAVMRALKQRARSMSASFEPQEEDPFA